MKRRVVCLAIVLVSCGVKLQAQAPPLREPQGRPEQGRGTASGGQPPAPGSGQAPQKPAPAEPPSDTYTYQAEGRRDPFLSLVGVGTDQRPGTSRKGEGPSGMSLNEISVRGVVQSRGGLVAMIQGPDNKSYIVHQGDKLLDGAIKAITPQGLVVLQEVNDPLSLVKQREVRKLLRSLEDGKE